MKIGVILGSTRLQSNTAGITNYVLSILSTRFPTHTIELINLRTSPNHPLPLQLDFTIPAVHKLEDLPNAYSDPLVGAWSATVLSWDAVIVVTPQYNWSVPAPLKNAFDQLLTEWKGKPIAFMAAGGHGGNKVVAALREICGGGLKMRVAEKAVGFKLAMDYIAGDKRFVGDEEYFKDYEAAVVECVKELEGLVAAGGRM
ncbi:flavo protein-like protein [Blyttiomyces helicus]|uniref:Flavo protein-like protein n=1 Tax=Blyttiomyces helicus TaxID=388810 RepID=A0A4P9WIY8_9FUNG|nr:flavo protein-like protein [Blyttiomyces helicus]|eukprot:RKO92869.1 flavo protein-like protein [Blyttiomyces helicus]